jgi:hypothetical protein
MMERGYLSESANIVDRYSIGIRDPIPSNSKVADGNPCSSFYQMVFSTVSFFRLQYIFFPFEKNALIKFQFPPAPLTDASKLP